MMIKTDKIAQLLEAPDKVADPLVITPQPDCEALRKKGAASVDLRLGCWFAALRQTRASLLDIREAGPSMPAENVLTKMHYVRFGEKFVLHPHSFVLGVTLEWIRLPSDLGGYVTSKSSWGRRGLIIATATGVHPGFTGCLTLELSNVGEIPVALYPSMEICQFFLHTVDSASDFVDQSSLAGRRKPFMGAISFDPVAQKLSR